MEFREKLAFGAVTGVFVVVSLGFTAAGLGVDFHAERAVEWVGAIGSGLGGIGAAVAAWISFQATQSAEAQRRENDIARFEIERAVIRDAIVALLGSTQRKLDFARGLHKLPEPQSLLYPLFNTGHHHPPMNLFRFIADYESVTRKCESVLKGLIEASSIQDLVSWRTFHADLRVELSSIDQALNSILRDERERHGLKRDWTMPD